MVNNKTLITRYVANLIFLLKRSIVAEGRGASLASDSIVAIQSRSISRDGGLAGNEKGEKETVRGG
jgi:hypothetical protein